MAERGDAGLIKERPESPPEGEDTARADVAPAQPPLIPLELQVVVPHPPGAGNASLPSGNVSVPQEMRVYLRKCECTSGNASVPSRNGSVPLGMRAYPQEM